MPKWLPIDESYGGFHLDRHSNSTGRCTYSEYSRGRENSRYADFHSFRYGGCRKKIYAMGCKAIVVKGGHHIGNAVDVLFNGENFYHLKHPALIRKYSWDRLYLFFCNRFPACKGKKCSACSRICKGLCHNGNRTLSCDWKRLWPDAPFLRIVSAWFI